MSVIMDYLHNLLAIYLDTAIWLLLGLFLAALIKGKIPDTLIQRWLNQRSIGGVIRAAIIGAPLPLCSCGVLPTAIGLKRSGASKPATVAFLIATPETGVDSITVSYALLGPIMAIIRPFAALISAIYSGLIVLFFDKDTLNASTTAEEKQSQTNPVENCCSSKEAPAKQNTSYCASKTAPTPEVTGCCSSKASTKVDSDSPSKSCCSTETKEVAQGCCGNKANETRDCCSDEPQKAGFIAGLRFAIVEILDDIVFWLSIGLLLAAAVATLVEPNALTEVGSGFGAMLVMLIVGLPLYICATASTPLAAAMLAAGVSPGAVMVFLLVGPATNIGSLGILQKELGIRALSLYLFGIASSALILGSLTNLFFAEMIMDSLVAVQQTTSHGTEWLKYLAGVLLAILAIKPLRYRLWHA